MYFILVLLIVTFLVGLFTIYALSNDDFVLMRKSISLDMVFNNAFLAFLVGMFVARVVFVLFHFDKAYINPLVFLFIPRFPGMFVMSGIVGAIIFMQVSFRLRKIYFPRLFDFYSLGTLSALSIWYLLSTVYPLRLVLPNIISGIVLLILLTIFIALFKKNKLKDGSTGLLSLSSIALALVLNSIISSKFKIIIPTPDAILSIGVFVLSLILFVQKERFFRRKK